MVPLVGLDSEDGLSRRSSGGVVNRGHLRAGELGGRSSVRTDRPEGSIVNVRFSLLRVGLTGTLLVVSAAYLGPIFAPYGPHEIDITRELMSPEMAGGLGTGVNGIDVFSWLLHGARARPLVGFSVVGIGLTVGLGVGLIAGYFGGWFDTVLMRIIDVLLVFLEFLLAIYIAAILPPSLGNVILALSVTGWVGYAWFVGRC